MYPSRLQAQSRVATAADGRGLGARAIGLSSDEMKVPHGLLSAAAQDGACVAGGRSASRLSADTSNVRHAGQPRCWLPVLSRLDRADGEDRTFQSDDDRCSRSPSL